MVKTPQRTPEQKKYRDKLAHDLKELRKNGDTGRDLAKALLEKEQGTSLYKDSETKNLRNKETEREKRNEDLGVFRKDLLKHFYEYDKSLSGDIKKLGDKLIKNGDFYFEDTEYGKVGVIKLNGSEYRFLSMDKISEDLMKKYGLKYGSDKGIIRKVSHGLGNKWYHSDIIKNKYMPGGSEEDGGVKKMVDDISHDIGLETVNPKFMIEFGTEVMKALGKLEDTEDKHLSEKGLYLYAYLMGPTSLGNSFLDDYPTYEGNVEELRGNLAFYVDKNSSTYEKQVTPMICALNEDGGKLFFASKKSTNEG